MTMTKKRKQKKYICRDMEEVTQKRFAEKCLSSSLILCRMLLVKSVSLYTPTILKDDREIEL